MSAAPEKTLTKAETASHSGSSSSGSSSGDEDGWQDVEPDFEDNVTIKAFFGDETFTDASEMFAACRAATGFDFLATRRRLGLDFHGAVKLANFVRQCARDGTSLPEPIVLENLSSDTLLKPVVDNDGLIMALDEVLDADDAAHASTTAVGGEEAVKLAQRNAELEEKLQRLTEQFASYRVTVEETLEKRWGDVEEKRETKGPAIPEAIDQNYFESYAGYGEFPLQTQVEVAGKNTNLLDIHETMLKDTVRTEAYRDFVYANKQLFKDKVVLDIGCGTGILSMFCAKAGAKQVIAVDNSAIINKARENIFNNGLSDKITCVAGRIEEVTLPVATVDIIISEWMGYALLYEAMLQSVLWARDKYLAPGGLLVPSVSTLVIAPVSDTEYMTDCVDFWDDVYGFNMGAMKKKAMAEARVEHMRDYSLAGTESMFKRLELHETAEADLVFTEEWSSTITKDTDALHGFLVWFDIFFTKRDEVVPVDKLQPSKWHDEASGKIAFTTGPLGKETHWKQSLMLIDPDNVQPVLKAGQKIGGTVVWSIPKEDPRSIVVEVSWNIDGGKEQRQSWNLR
ncbi:hypothetical protein TD95_004755 [Thielaviopsis punctulata]|uniref:type I protein arginine methyltransferase n=1 Tax=Thielaviopsis punctulata TaxID=72032 RepID=A0A0F4ZEQ6_9PEZI|nr:hypothetical protein TD95_004755 [Thielaviopsis punctulata]